MSQSTRKSPNLIYVFADQLRYSSCGYAGDTAAHTPNIDHFASESMDFANTVSVFPVCGPYRASLFTGKYPSSTGTFTNDLRCMPDPDAIAEVLKEHNYRTAYIGKWHLYGTKAEEQFVPQGPYRLGFNDHWQGYCWNNDYHNGFFYQDTEVKQQMPHYQTVSQTDMAIDYMKKADKDTPFAMVLSYEVPHPPYDWENCLEEYVDIFKRLDIPTPINCTGEELKLWATKFTKEWWDTTWGENRAKYAQIYYALTAILDHNFGRLLKAIDDLGLAEDTIVVFSSDHGEMLGAHDRLDKRTFFEESLHVPFLIRWPNHIPADRTAACFNTPDIMPTLLDLMGLSIPCSVEGNSFAGHALGIEQDTQNIAFLQGMCDAGYYGNDEWRAVRNDHLIYVVSTNKHTDYLFDFIEDPYQLNNLLDHPAYAQELVVLKRSLVNYMEQLQDAFKTSQWYYDNWSKDGIVLRSATR